MEAGTRPQHVDVDKLIDDRPISALQLRVIVLCGSLVFLDGYDIQTLAVSINWLSSEWNLTRGDFTLAQTAAVVGYTFDFRESEFYFGDLRWLKLDIENVQTKGTLLDKVDLSKVDEIGFVDLTPGSGHGQGGYSDVGWIEVYGNPVPRK